MTIVEFSVITLFFVFGLATLLMLAWVSRKDSEGVKAIILLVIALIVFTTPAYFPLFRDGLIF